MKGRFVAPSIAELLKDNINIKRERNEESS